VTASTATSAVTAHRQNDIGHLLRRCMLRGMEADCRSSGKPRFAANASCRDLRPPGAARTSMPSSGHDMAFLPAGNEPSAATIGDQELAAIGTGFGDS